MVAKLEEEEYDVGLQMEFSLPKSRHNSTIRILYKLKRRYDSVAALLY